MTAARLGFAYNRHLKALKKRRKCDDLKENELGAQNAHRQKSVYEVAEHNAVSNIVQRHIRLAFGLLQICALRFSSEINAPKFRWLRSRSNDIPSESNTSHFMGKNLFRMITLRSDLPIMHFILVRQNINSADIHHDDSRMEA